jgi:hypothetical protein
VERFLSTGPRGDERTAVRQRVTVSCPSPFRYGYQWDQNPAEVGFVTPYIARRVAWFVGVSSIALLLAALILYLIARRPVPGRSIPFRP